MIAAITASSDFRLTVVSLDKSFSISTDSDRKREQVAIFDLLDTNTFLPVNHDGGPYRLDLALVARRLFMSVTTRPGGHVFCHHLLLAPFRQLLKDYALVCDSYANAKALLSPRRVEAIDIGRRNIHNGAAALLRERLKSKVGMGQETARGLFTPISLLVNRNSLYRG